MDRRLVAVLALGGLALAACDGGGGTGASCAPGAVRSCSCGGSAAVGGQTCGADGAWLPCEDCQAGGDGAPDPDGPLQLSDGGAASLVRNATVRAAAHTIGWKSCGAIPAELGPLQPGEHTLTLTSSTLSKGSGAKDDYLIVHLPVPPEQGSQRYGSLNGVGDALAFTVTQAGMVYLWFIDSDVGGNEGQATVTVTPTGESTTVSATDNLIEWGKPCGAAPALMQDVPVGSYTVELLASTLTAAGYAADLVLVRLPLELGNAASHNRYVVLNGVGASLPFTFGEESWGAEPVRIWLIDAAGSGLAGEATVGLQ